MYRRSGIWRNKMTIREEGGDYHLPNRILDITDCGVAADGKTDVTGAINQCLARAVSEGCHTVFSARNV